MNAAARAINTGSVFTGTLPSLESIQQVLGLWLLVASVLFSAFSVVYVKDLNRRVFSELQMAQAHRDQLKMEWGQLLLEESTWAAQSRIARIADRQLMMQMPRAKDVRMIRLDS